MFLRINVQKRKGSTFTKNKQIKAVHVYPGADEKSKIRTIAHGIKQENDVLTFKAAKEMASLVPAGSVLVPVPGSDGYATSSLGLALALAIAKIKGLVVVDALQGSPRVSQYESKKLALRF